MSDQYIGEIRLFSGNYAPQGWAFCDGQLVDINQYTALYTLIGTTYGGDGRTTFALPDLRGRLPIHMGVSSTGVSYSIGQKDGVEKVTLTSSQLPNHTHEINAQSAGGASNSPANAFSASGSVNLYSNAAPNNTMNSGAISSAGGNQAHDNMMPFLTLSYIIAVEGLFPSRN